MARDQVTTLTMAADVRERSDSQGSGIRRSLLQHDVSFALGMAYGTSDNQADLVYSARTTVTNGAPDDYDLSGSLTSLLTGASVNFVEICWIVVVNESTTAGDFVAVGGGSNPLVNWVSAGGDAVNVGPGGCLMVGSPIDGYAVTASTADILRINTSSANTITYRLIIIGRSA